MKTLCTEKGVGGGAERLRRTRAPPRLSENFFFSRQRGQGSGRHYSRPSNAQAWVASLCRHLPLVLGLVGGPCDISLSLSRDKVNPISLALISFLFVLARFD